MRAPFSAAGARPARQRERGGDGPHAAGDAAADDALDGDDFELPALDAAAGTDPAEPPVRHFLGGTDGNGVRLDKYLAGQMPEVSRSRLQRWIEDDAVLLNGAVARTRAAAVYAGDRIDVRASASAQSLAYGPEPIPIDVVWEDDTLIVVDKPAGLVVHPGAGNWSGTLLNGLLALDPRLADVPRAGIVHRLDAGTSGLMVWARTPRPSSISCASCRRAPWCANTGPW